MVRMMMGIAGQRQVRRLDVPRDGWRTRNAGRRMVYRRYGRHVARNRRRAGRRAVADVLAHAAGAHVTADTAAAATATADDAAAVAAASNATAANVSGRARLTAGRRTVTCGTDGEIKLTNK